MTTTAAELAVINGIFGFARRRLNRSRDFAWAAVAFAAHFVADYGRRYWQSGTGLTPESAGSKNWRSHCSCSRFSLPANKPAFLLLFSTFVLLAYWQALLPEVIRETKMSAIQGIEGVINQLQAIAMSVRAQGSLPQPTISLIGQLRAALDCTNDIQTVARTQAERFTLGEPGVALNGVMTDMQKAPVPIQTGIQVRNKLAAAYQEVMPMRV